LSNEGKKFEDDFKNSIPKDIIYARLKDDTMKFKNVVNVCDYILYQYPYIYPLELKSHKGKSIPFDCIREEQASGLFKWSARKGVKAGFIFNFRDTDETYFVDAVSVKQFMEAGERKSFPIEWCKTHGRRIIQNKLRTRFRYELNKFLDEV
jgi:recombination protein U